MKSYMLWKNKFDKNFKCIQINVSDTEIKGLIDDFSDIENLVLFEKGMFITVSMTEKMLL